MRSCMLNFRNFSSCRDFNRQQLVKRQFSQGSCVILALSAVDHEDQDYAGQQAGEQGR